MNPPPVPPATDSLDVHHAESALQPSNPAINPDRLLTADDLGVPRRSRLVPILLFLATCFFTYAAGCYDWSASLFGTDNTGNWNVAETINRLTRQWRGGLLYMASVMTVLIFHEMGHFLMTVRYRVPASYPIFLPMPFMFTGTLGAVISMEGSRANRKQLFDIGLAGPLAGLIPTVALVWIGVKVAEPEIPRLGELQLGCPLFLQWMFSVLRPDLVGVSVGENPFLMAGWVGMLVTGLNMMPLSQLDGGHTVYALFLQRSHFIARAFLLLAMAFVVVYGLYTWTLMLVLVTFMGVDHPPTSNDDIPLGLIRSAVGVVSLAIPVLCFTRIQCQRDNWPCLRVDICSVRSTYMLRKGLLVGAILVGFATGCGRGTYDKKVESAIERARNPPAEGAKDEAKGDAANDDAAKDAAEGDAAKGDEAGKN